MIRLEASRLEDAQDAGHVLANALRKTADGTAIQVFGPTLAPLSKLVGRWRFQIILRGRNVPQFRTWIRTVKPELQKPLKRGVRMSIDVDPRSLL